MLQRCLITLCSIFHIPDHFKGGALQICPGTTCSPDSTPLSQRDLKCFRSQMERISSSKQVEPQLNLDSSLFNIWCTSPARLQKNVNRCTNCYWLWRGGRVNTGTPTPSQLWLSLIKKIGNDSERKGSLKCSLKYRLPHLWQTFLHPWLDKATFFPLSCCDCAFKVFSTKSKTVMSIHW